MTEHTPNKSPEISTNSSIAHGIHTKEMQTDIKAPTIQRLQVLHGSDAVNELVDDLTFSFSTFKLSPASGQVTSAVTHNIAGHSTCTFLGDHRYPPIIPSSINSEDNLQSKGAFG